MTRRGMTLVELLVVPPALVVAWSIVVTGIFGVFPFGWLGDTTLGIIALVPLALSFALGIVTLNSGLQT
jgi:hypothetical protein